MQLLFKSLDSTYILHELFYTEYPEREDRNLCFSGLSLLVSIWTILVSEASFSCWVNDYKNCEHKGFLIHATDIFLSDYAVSIFHDALTTGKHKCYLRPDCLLPMMYIDDCLRSLHDIMVAPEENLSCRVYNVAAMSFNPDMIYNEVKKHVPNLEIEYNIDDRQKIGK